tara:strand:+ start:594 stop:983 length:390 start_codon:yes stop_codon:yes gene_type:complete
MLDTNIVSDLARNPAGAVVDHIVDVGQDTICVSIITATELSYGCERKGSARLTTQIEAILGGMQILALDAPAHARYGRIRTELEAAGTPIGPNDLLIAAHALAVDAVLVTANTREFLRVPGLQVENWLD